MAKNNAINISVVVPVHNEEKYIKGCIKALKNQTTKPYEIILVDNNCTDKTISIAKKYKNISVIKEHSQGLCFARNTGFNAAKGNILLRIDADTYLPNNYIKELIAETTNNPRIAGFTGHGVSRFEFIPNSSRLVSWGYFKYADAYLGHQVLWGANMAVRSDYWKKLSKYLINDDSLVHEDQDVSLALASVGGKILVSKNLGVSVDTEDMQHFEKYNRYIKLLRNIKTLDRQHKRYKLTSRLPKTSFSKRIYFWIISAWGIYLAYFLSIIYSFVWNIKRFMLAH